MAEPDEVMSTFDPGPYVAVIERDCRWGPWAWSITFTQGPICIDRDTGWHAWTKDRAERKARRNIARWRRADDARKTSRTVIDG